MRKILLALGVFCFSAGAQAAFLDVDITHPYYQAISYLKSQKVIEGKPVKGKRIFASAENINRAEALKILMLSSKVDLKVDQMPFPDVQQGQWFYDYISTAFGREIVKGFPDGKFYPGAQVRRSEFLKMLFESFSTEVSTVTGSQAWFDPYFDKARSLKLLPRGDEPEALVSRGEAAEIIYRYIKAQESVEGEYVYKGTGIASYYHPSLAGNLTANGEIYDPQAMTVAHRTLPFGTRLKIENDSGTFVIARVNDRGPYHKDRVLDLSEKVFSKLAPMSKGIIKVKFSVFQDEQSSAVPIPEQIAPYLESELKVEKVPEAFQSQLRSSAPEDSDNKTLSKSVDYEYQPLFLESVSNLSTDFFPGMELRKPIPKKLINGTVMQVSGRVENRVSDAVIFFTQDRNTNEQKSFEADLSGNNFSFNLPFVKTGSFYIGAAFETGESVKVGEIEVVDAPRFRRYPASEDTFRSDINLDLFPEEKAVTLSWMSGSDRVTKLEVTQGPRKKILYFEDGLNTFDLGFDFFEDFKINEKLSFDLFQAGSADGSLDKQRTNWKKLAFENYKLIEGFPDAVKKDMVAMINFERYRKNLDQITIQGKLLDLNQVLAEKVFIIDPDGEVFEIKNYVTGSVFRFAFTPEKEGQYVVEVISNKGEIFFNRAIYISKEHVLPVFPKKQLTISNDRLASLTAWTNLLRQNAGRFPLPVSNSLSQVAQEYAERMANENFIAHVDPEGLDVGHRISHLPIRSYGENLSFGTDLQLAINGLENSASHRQTILSTRWENMGLGLAQNNKGHYYVVQIFARN